jgi:hypothetical protein
MTPEILGSSGHMQLGGDLISLKTFLGLKALLAEQILACYPPRCFMQDVESSGQWSSPIGYQASVSSFSPLFVERRE